MTCYLSRMVNEYGAALRKVRTDAGKTLQALANHIGVSIPYLSDVELGRRSPLTTERTLLAASFCGASPRPLLDAAILIKGAALDASLSAEHAATALALLSAWSRLTPEALLTIRQIATDHT